MQFNSNLLIEDGMEECTKDARIRREYQYKELNIEINFLVYFNELADKSCMIDQFVISSMFFTFGDHRICIPLRNQDKDVVVAYFRKTHEKRVYLDVELQCGVNLMRVE